MQIRSQLTDAALVGANFSAVLIYPIVDVRAAVSSFLRFPSATSLTTTPERS